jgi:hypothetical protein
MKFCVVAAVNNESVLENNLADSLLIKQGVETIFKREYDSASNAFNEALCETDADVIIFAHQDVYLPKPWLIHLTETIDEIETVDLDWSVIGVFGVTDEGSMEGHCWSTGLNMMLGSPFGKPRHASTIDELVIVLRKSSGLQFDEKLPGFHLYGADIVQTAITSGFSAYIVDAPVVHNSKRVKSLSGPYTSAYRYMQKKWRNRLPITTPVTTITRFGLPLLRLKFRLALRRFRSSGKKLYEKEQRQGRDIARQLRLDCL